VKDGEREASLCLAPARPKIVNAPGP